MDPLNVKLWRDLWRMRGQTLAIILVIAAGVATYVMALCTLESLKRAQAEYYEQYRFAEVFAHAKRAPQALEARIAAIPGVAQVQTRVVANVKIQMPGLTEPATAKLISAPDPLPAALNQLHVRKGRYLEPGAREEAIVSEGFAEVHGLTPGDRVQVIMNGRLRELVIVGIAVSPEFIYQIREGDILPDDRRFGVFWMNREELASAFDLGGAFNDVACTLMPGAVEPAVLRQLDLLTEPYGGTGAIGRADQSSNKFVMNELQELRGMAVIVPTIFLGISAFLLNMVISRLIGLEREQIAALKAFGYTRYEIGWHYVKLVLLFVVLGSVLGTVVGAYLGELVSGLYRHFFRFVALRFYLDPRVVLSAVAVTAGAAIVGTLATVWRAAALPPAEAMRPEPPATFGPSVMERFGLQRLLPESARMILRQLERRPVKSLLTCLGIALAIAALILGSFSLDAIDYAIHAQYFVAMREDLNVLFTEPSSNRALHCVERLRGVRLCEPFRAVAARMRRGHAERRVEILGLSAEGELHRLMDVDCRKVPLPAEGVVLSEKLGEVLGVRVGDQVQVEILEGQRPNVELPVVGLVNDFAGTAVYMRRDALNRLMREADVISGAFVAADAGVLDELYGQLKNAPRVAAVSIKGAAIQSFRETIAENILRMRSFIVLFASVIAVGVVYNSASISLAERGREMATLRVIGFSRAEVSLLLLGELALLTLAAIPVGMLLGYGLAGLVIRFSYDTELFRLPLVINRSTYGFAVVVTLAAALGSVLAVRRRLDRLDLVAVLKTKE